MIELLIAILSLSNAAPVSNMSDVINFAKRYMELPLVEANKLAAKEGLSNKDRAVMKGLWFFTELGDKSVNALNLSIDDAGVIAEIISTTKPRNDEEFIAELMKKSPDLGARAKNMHDLEEKQLAELTPEVQAHAKIMREYIWKSKLFVDEFATLTPSAIQEMTLGLIDKFKALPDDAKEYFQKANPAGVAFLTSEETVKRLQER